MRQSTNPIQETTQVATNPNEFDCEMYKQILSMCSEAYKSVDMKISELRNSAVIEIVGEAKLSQIASADSSALATSLECQFDKIERVMRLADRLDCI